MQQVKLMTVLLKAARDLRRSIIQNRRMDAKRALYRLDALIASLMAEDGSTTVEAEYNRQNLIAGRRIGERVPKADAYRTEINLCVDCGQYIWTYPISLSQSPPEAEFPKTPICTHCVHVRFPGIEWPWDK